MEDFAKADKEKEPEKKWDRAESYFIELTEPISLFARLKVWQFTFKWPEDSQRA